MERLLEELRRRPKAVRAQIAFVVASSVTGLIFVLWLFGLGERIGVESADPTIAAYQREQAAATEERPLPESTIGSVFSRLQRGAAALIFNQEPAAPVDTEATTTKTIDIDALLAAPPARPTANTNGVADRVNTTTNERVGTSTRLQGESVILIGTSTAERSQ